MSRVKTLAVFALGIVTGLLLMNNSAVASGDDKQLSQESEYIRVVMYAFDTPLTFTDVNGKEVQPFTIDGTTYAPIRGIVNALGKDIRWEEWSNTVRITAMHDDTRQAYAGPGDPDEETRVMLRDLFAARMKSNDMVDEVYTTRFAFWGYDANFRYCFAVDYNIKPAADEGFYDNPPANSRYIFNRIYDEPLVAIRGEANEETGWITGRRKFVHAYVRDGVLYDWSISDNQFE